MLSVSFLYLYWGGEPYKLLRSSPSISEGIIKEVQNQRRWIVSNNYSFEKLLLAREKSWIDFPLPKSKMRVFLTSTLHEASGSRPLWYTLALFLEKNKWQTIRSHRNLCEALDNHFKAGWWGPEGGIESLQDIQKEIDLKVSSYASSDEDSAYYKALFELEEKFNFTNVNKWFSARKFAMNPAALPDGKEWEIMNPAGRRIPTSPVKQKQRREQERKETAGKKPIAAGMASLAIVVLVALVIFAWWYIQLLEY